MDAIHQLVVVAIKQIVPANTVVKEGIPGKDDPMPQQANAIRSMPRCMKDREVKVTDVDTIASLKHPVGVWRSLTGWFKGVSRRPR